jgi:catechol 2,3-dioxygenase-like lactoylglutathione lyase family enzyme
MADIIKRTTLIVRDADRAARWYEQVFGMTRWMDTPFTLSGTQLAAGEKGDHTRLVIMKAEDDVIGMIGLLQWVDPPMDAPAALPDRVTFGQPIFVVAAADATATCDRARSAGSRIHCDPRNWSTTGADGREIEMVGTSFFDLDGYFYEVNQRIERG